MNGEITRWLARLRGGDEAALEHLVPLLYDELKGLARGLMRNEREGHTLTPTALVHEMYLRLSRERRIGAEDRGAFFAVAATTMRRILVDSARSRQRLKRGGEFARVPLDEVANLLSDREAEELLAVDEILEGLAAASPRAKQVVELRLFVGLSLEETASVLEVNERTVRRDWQLSHAWLRDQLAGRSGLGRPGEAP